MGESNNLPPFPVDDSALDMLDAALNPGPDAERTSLGELLTLYSEMGGSDTRAVSSEEDGICIMRDQHYHDHDVIRALVAEVRKLRRFALVVA